MDKVLQDSTGTYQLASVVAITPLRFTDRRTGALIKELAQLHFSSGEVCNTQTDYKTAWSRWQAVVNPQPASSQPAAAGAAA